MSSNQNKTIEELESLLKFSDEADKLNLEAELLHLKFVGVLEELMKKARISKTELAERLSLSGGYITQLFAGDKLFTFKMLVNLQHALDFNFKIEAESKRPNFAIINGQRFKKHFTAGYIKKGRKDLKCGAEEPQRTLVA